MNAALVCGRSMLRPTRHWLNAATLVAAAFLCPFKPALASSLQVSPILLEFSGQEQSQGLWIRNNGQAPMRAQVRVMRWTQDDGTEALAPTRDLVASPAVLEIAPGERQLVRIVLLDDAPKTREVAFRLLVDELPSWTRPEDGGLRFLLRYSIPAFVVPPVQPAPGAPRPLAVAWENGRLSVANAGDRRVRLAQLAWVADDGGRLALVPGLLGYVLAGQRMEWPLEKPRDLRAGGKLVARFDDEHEEQVLPLLAPVR